jgi:AcrR family transcriptional regulator
LTVAKVDAPRKLTAVEGKAAERQAAFPRAQGHNLNGQKLGRKGRDTRERILAAASDLLIEPGNPPITLSAVARKVPLGMTSLYNYFTDLTELLLALLEPIMETAGDAYLGHLRERWPDEDLNAHCFEFIRDYYAFWQKNTRILHLRNSLSEGNLDVRMAKHRIRMGIPMVELLTFQMGHDPEIRGSEAYSMATALFTGIDRLVAVRTATEWLTEVSDSYYPILNNQLRAEARLLELAIRDGRAHSSS